jgi:siroheme synthase-like protein
MGNRYFPVFLDLQDQPCLVVGEGRLAREKADALVAAGARVQCRVQFEESEGLAAFLIIAVTSDRELGGKIAGFARQHRILANVLDQTENCNFIFPAVLYQGDLSIAVSSSGKSPLLAVSIRDELKERYGPEYAVLLEILGEVRTAVQLALPCFADRKAYYQSVMRADLLTRICREGREKAERFVHDLLKERIHLVSRGLTPDTMEINSLDKKPGGP